ncbi:hypothetical protein COOONC_20145 [Cooperia oncophora]
MRDLAVFLAKEVERQFNTEPSSLDIGLCERRFRALEQIHTNTTAKLYPHQYKSGVFGLNLEQLQEVMVDEEYPELLKITSSTCRLIVIEIALVLVNPNYSSKMVR